ncbi:MAG: winged helix-turn-helix transcriptional regulator [Reyranella sp.]|nr:winged helix-turn-helix transcriptional regulator [Reyranella sp.]
MLLYCPKDGTKRFSDLRRDNPTVSHRMLSRVALHLDAYAARKNTRAADRAEDAFEL